MPWTRSLFLAHCQPPFAFILPKSCHRRHQTASPRSALFCASPLPHTEGDAALSLLELSGPSLPVQYPTRSLLLCCCLAPTVSIARPPHDRLCGLSGCMLVEHSHKKRHRLVSDWWKWANQRAFAWLAVFEKNRRARATTARRQRRRPLVRRRGGTKHPLRRAKRACSALLSRVSA